MPEDDAGNASQSTREQQLREITVGELRPLNRTIRLAPHDPEWKSIYASEARRIRDALGSRVLLLEHVGSTSIPDLAAKPGIDMVMAVADSADEDAYVPALEAIGYTLRIREPDWYEHRMFVIPEISGQLHVLTIGCEETDRLLLFRDWLRNHPEDRKVYEDAKKELASRVWKYGSDYAQAKSRVVREILARARTSASY